MFDLPVYLEQPGEHPEMRTLVGWCKVSLEESKAPLPRELKGNIKITDEFAWLNDMLDTVDCTMGFGPTGAALVLRPETHIGGKVA